MTVKLAVSRSRPPVLYGANLFTVENYPDFCTISYVTWKMLPVFKGNVKDEERIAWRFCIIGFILCKLGMRCIRKCPTIIRLKIP